MKNFAVIACLAVLFSSCGKDKFSSVPQIKFNSIKPGVYISGGTNTDGLPKPFLSIQLTDAEGDFGFEVNKDTSYVYIKNLTIPPFDTDSIPFPLSLVRKSNLDAEVAVDLFNAKGLVQGTIRPVKPSTDTVFYEVYVKDFAKNKSNVIKTDDPLFIITR